MGREEISGGDTDMEEAGARREEGLHAEDKCTGRRGLA